jgi:hypothetical protein
MSDKLVGFLEIIKRLLLVLELPNEVALAERLGLQRAAYTMRKQRDSVPLKHLEALCTAEDLSLEYILYGTGNVHVPLEGQTWEQLYQERAQCIPAHADYLFSMGHPKKTIDELAIAAKPVARYLHLLRDLNHSAKVDLTWLIAATQNETADVTRDEQALLKAYRSADKPGQEFIRRAAGMAKK